LIGRNKQHRVLCSKFRWLAFYHVPLLCAILYYPYCFARPPVLPPARPLISPASGGLLGLGCEGDLWFSARWCRLGTSLSRFVFPGRCPSGVGEAMTAAARWNKSLQLLHCLGDVSSGIGEGLVSVGSHGAGCLIDARFLLVLRDSKVGVGFQRFKQGMSAKLWRGMTAGLLVTWWVDLDLFFAVHRRGG